MPDWQEPSFVDAVTYLDSYWQKMIEREVLVVDYEDAIMANSEVRESVEVQDEIDFQRTARLSLVLLYFSFSDQVAKDLLDRCLASTILGTLTALNVAIDHHRQNNPIAHRPFKTMVAFSVSKYALTELSSFPGDRPPPQNQQAIEDISNRLGVSQEVMSMLRKAQDHDVESYLSGDVD